MPQSLLDIVIGEPIGVIRPELYGHFMEHLGGCIDGGCWVGADSSIPNDDGVRLDVVEALKAINPPVMRWPGGCYADDYHWRDGIGPRAQRPRRINMHWGDCIEKNEFGTHEFLAFCRAIGAKPYMAGNLGSGSPKEMRDWVEYCNFPGGSTISDERIANGAKDPFAINYWGVGNENWGCGGNFSPEDYAAEYRRFSTYLRNWGGTQMYLVACGPNGNDAEWTRRFFDKLKKDFWDGAPIHGYAAHHYCHSESTATEFDESHWYELFKSAVKMEPLIVDQRKLMDRYDPDRKIGLIVDEWGAWHRPTPGRNPAFQWQQSTVRDALVAALTLDIFNRHADKIVMGNVAQTINVIQSLLLTEEDKMIKTPTYHVFDLYQDHKGGESQRLVVSGQALELGLPHLAGSSSTKGNLLTLTVANLSATDAVDTEIRLVGGIVKKAVAARGISYPKGDIHAHNTFDDPNVVTLLNQELPKQTGSRSLVATFAAASVTKITLELGA